MSARDRDRLKVLHEVGGAFSPEAGSFGFPEVVLFWGRVSAGGADMLALGMSATDKGVGLPATRRHSWVQNHPQTSRRRCEKIRKRAIVGALTR
jgi:hypothetical protein